MNDGVIFYRSHFENIQELNDEELGQIFRACMTGETGTMSPHVKMAFAFLSSQIKRDIEKYALITEKRRKAGRLGGIAKGKKTENQENTEIANLANANCAKQNIANLANESNNINNNINSNKKNNIKTNIKNDTSNDVSSNKEVVSVVTPTPSVDSLRERSSWIEQVAMNYGLSVHDVHGWLDRFEAEVVNCKMKTHANTKDLASHFCDWMRIKRAAEEKQSGSRTSIFDEVSRLYQEGKIGNTKEVLTYED